MTDPAPRIVRADTPQGPCAQLHGRWGAAELGTGTQWQAVSGQLRSHPAAPTLGWDLIRRLKDMTTMKVVIKGLESLEDAQRAVELATAGQQRADGGGAGGGSGHGWRCDV